jgi:hypothetical protein
MQIVEFELQLPQMRLVPSSDFVTFYLCSEELRVCGTIELRRSVAYNIASAQLRRNPTLDICRNVQKPMLRYALER